MLLFAKFYPVYLKFEPVYLDAFLIRRPPLKEPEVLLELALVILLNFYLTPQEISITKVYVLMIGYLILSNWVFSSIHEWRT